MLDSVRTRLTLWYVGVLALVLVAFSVGVYVLLARTLYDRMDNELRSAAKATAVALVTERAEGESDQEAAGTALAELYLPVQAIAVFDAGGGLIAEKPAPGNLHSQLPTLSGIDSDTVRLFTLPEDPKRGDDGRRVAVQRVSVPPTGTPYLIVVSQSFESVNEGLERMRGIFYFAVPLALTLAGMGGWFLAQKSLSPVAVMSEHARRISSANLEERLPVANPRDELGRLAASFNELLERLNTAFAQQQRFMTDASHELRTPLSVVRTAVEVTLEREHRSESEYREALMMIVEQTQRMTRLVEDMFALARADGGHEPLRCSDFCLDELLMETTRAAEVLASRKGVRIETPGFARAPYRGDVGLLRQMILNLLDNAIKYTPSGGVVRVNLQSEDSKYDLTIADTGMGIPPEAQSHIFERFFRADPARSREGSSNGGGAGLGLSISRWIAEAHGGRLVLSYSSPSGSAFVASLPRN
ncbi:MAG: ATP-binding protein [Terriglobia bacterium]